MAKDSQMDNKKARSKKAKGQISLTQENQNQGPNAKKQRTQGSDV